MSLPASHLSIQPVISAIEVRTYSLHLHASVALY